MSRCVRRVVLLLTAAAATACGGDADDVRDAGGAPEAEPVGEAAAPDASDSASVPAGAEEVDPFAGFGIEIDSGPAEDSRRIALSLRNDGDRPAIVHADGGAGEILLDTVPSRETVRVDVHTRARRITLRSESADGTVLRMTEVEAGPDTVIDVWVGGRPADP